MTPAILITGCSTGIGRHCALRLKHDGWQVFATARKEADIEALQREGLDAIYLDYAVTHSLEAALDKVLARTGGRLDALFNNGAYGQPGAVEDLSIEVLRAQFEANFFGPHELTRLVIPHMRKQGSGRIVHCSSILGLVPYRWRGAYNASKHALEGLMMTQRMELAQSGIHVSLIEPGPITSKFGDNALMYFHRNVDIAGSVHQEAYRHHLAKLEAGGGVNRFRLGPEAVYRKLQHALVSKHPRAQYAVTVPAIFISYIRSVAPQWLMDRLLLGND
ncbi:MAG: SDR family oxidoreductase [Rhizobiaceae bacterium]